MLVFTCLPLLQTNVDLNSLKNCKVSPLSWGTSDVLNFPPNSYDLILAADCVYWDTLHSPLKSTLLTLLSLNANSVCLICGVRRWKSDNHFYRSLNDVKDKGGRLRCEKV